MRGLLMVPVALAFIAMATADAQTTAPDRKGGEGKSAQRFLTTRPADFGNDDNNIIFESNRGDRNDRRNFGLGGSSAFVTPNPTRIVTVSTSPGLSVSPGFGRDQVLGGFNRDQILFDGDNRFNQIYSPGSFFPGNGIGGGIRGGGIFGGSGIGGNVLGGGGFGAGFQSNDGTSRYLELLVARDPLILLQNPELLLQYPQLILIRPDLISQYPQLRQYVDPRILSLGPSPFDLDNQQVPFRRVFPQTFLGNAGNFGNVGNFGNAGNFGNFGSLGNAGNFGNFGSLGNAGNFGNSNFGSFGNGDGSRFGGFNNVGGFGQGIDFQRPIDIGSGGFNRPILTTIAPPLNFGTINPNRNIRFSKKK